MKKVIISITLIVVCLACAGLVTFADDATDLNETMFLGLEEGEYYDFYHQTRENQTDSTKTDHRIICVMDLNWLYQAPIAEITIRFSNNNGSVNESFSFIPKTVYKSITATADGKTVTYRAEDGLVILGWVITNVPNEVSPQSTAIKNGSEGLAYVLDSTTNSYSVSGIGTCSDTDIVIPNTYRGKVVSKIGYRAFYKCTNITSIVIPDSVTTVGNCELGVENYAFYGCSNLASVSLPKGVTSIGEYAFAKCNSLASIMLPDKVANIDERAFFECSNLANIALGDGVKSIEPFAFAGCSSLASITIPNSVTSIGEGVFLECVELSSIAVASDNSRYYSKGNCIIERTTNTLVSGCKETVIPDTVKAIGKRAFEGCKTMTHITIPNSVTTIGEYAFTGCSSLSNITVSNSVTSIGYGAFLGCNNLTSIALPFVGDGVQYHHFGYIFGATASSYHNKVIPSSLKTVVITGGTSIGRYAFEGCNGLSNITVPNSVTTIGEYAFSGCSSLTDIAIPKSVESVGVYAFHGCTTLAIYCEAECKPDGWSGSWNPSNRPVVWGCTNDSL